MSFAKFSSGFSAKFTPKFSPKFSRRTMLRAIAALSAGGGAAAVFPGRAAALPKERRYFVVFTCTGGASITDSLLAVRASECADADRLNTFPDHEVVDFPGSPFRAVRLSDETIASRGFMSTPLVFDRDAQAAFVEHRRRDLLLVQYDASSINHPIAQTRALTGANAWRGRTIQECAALAQGEALPLPNVNMGRVGYLEDGRDPDLPAWARREALASPLDWCFGLDGSRGLEGLPSRALIDRARDLRDLELDAKSTFHRRFAGSEALSAWERLRREKRAQFEHGDLYEKLNVRALNEVTEVFPRYQDDPLEAQAALAFLLIKHDVSSVITIGPGYDPVWLPEGGMLNPLVSFDMGHQHARLSQAAMWSRVFGVADRLIALLEKEQLWERTLLYFMSEFGRSPERTPGDLFEPLVFGTTHDPNGAVLLASPLLRGDTFLGGIDKNTLRVHGFDLTSGEERADRRTTEAELFGGILQGLGVDTSASGLPEVRAMRRG